MYVLELTAQITFVTVQNERIQLFFEQQISPCMHHSLIPPGTGKQYIIMSEESTVLQPDFKPSALGTKD